VSTARDDEPSPEEGGAAAPEDGAVEDGAVEDGGVVEEDTEPKSVPLLEPRDGLPPLVTTAEALAEAVRALGAGTGPVAVDAERASAIARSWCSCAGTARGRS
jgi:hypothetical protein